VSLRRVDETTTYDSATGAHTAHIVQRGIAMWCHVPLLMDQLLRTNQRAKVATSVRRLYENIVKHPTDQNSRDDIAMISNLVIVDHAKWPR
jgi:hypothetical protein